MTALAMYTDRGMLRDLPHPTRAFAAITPNWYATVMGTGIVAAAAAGLPVHISGLRTLAAAM